MFDLRYHVASLTAVFLALVIGILVGVGIADRGPSTRRRRTCSRRGSRSSGRGSTRRRSAQPSGREQRAAQLYMKETYPMLVHNRLRGKRIAVVFIG